MTTICAFSGFGVDPWVADTFGRLSDNDLVFAFDCRGLMRQSVHNGAELMFEQMEESTVIYEDMDINLRNSESDIQRIKENVRMNEISASVPTDRLRIIVVSWPEEPDSQGWKAHPSYFTQKLGTCLDCDALVLIASSSEATYFPLDTMHDKLSIEGWFLQKACILPDHRKDIMQLCSIYTPNRVLPWPNMDHIVAKASWDKINTPNDEDIETFKRTFDLELIESKEPPDMVDYTHKTFDVEFIESKEPPDMVHRDEKKSRETVTCPYCEEDVPISESGPCDYCKCFFLHLIYDGDDGRYYCHECLHLNAWPTL
jgi:hypothetical protein